MGGGDNYYHPQTKCAKVMFLHLSIILFTGGSTSVHAGIHPPDQTPPEADTPSADTPAGITPPLPEQTPPRSKQPPPCAMHAGRYGQQAGGMHPTGMHTCLFVCTIVYGSVANSLQITEQSCGDMLHNNMHKNKVNVQIMLQIVVFQVVNCYKMYNILLFSQIYT